MADKISHENLHIVQKMAYGMPGIAAIAYAMYKHIVEIQSKINTTIVVCQVILGITVICLIVRWIGATMNELGQIEKYLGFARRIKGEVYIIVLLLALILTVLGFSYSNIYLFSIIFSGVCFFNMWGQYLTNSHIKKEWESGGITRTLASQAIKEYYLKRPQFPRIATMLAASLLVGQLAIAGYSTNNENYIFLAYVIMVVTIILAEVWIFIWRRRRDKEIDNYEYKTEKETHNNAN